MAVTLQLSIFGSTNGQQTAIIRHYHSPSAGNMPSAEEFCEQIADRFDTALMDQINATTLFTSMSIRNVVPASIGAAWVPAAWPVVGGGSGISMPPYVCFKVRFDGIAYAHPSLGWCRFPGPQESQQTAGIVDPAVMEDLQPALGDLFGFAPTTGGGAGAWFPCIYSRTHETFNPIANVTVINELTSQNTRKFGRGG